MGSRRMFSLKIINSARFLKMPIDAQNLYFHLGLRADDDGVVEAFPVMRLVGSSEDNLKLLHAKGMVRVLNEDLVTYITDWREHNNIRADRKIDSIYKNLLVEILPDVDLVTPKPRTDVIDNSRRLMTANNQLMDSPRTDYIQSEDSLSKDKLSKDKLSKDKKSKYGEYAHVLLTNEEFLKLSAEYQNANELIKFLDEYIEMKGYKAKNHYLCIKKWVVEAVNERKGKKTAGEAKDNVFTEIGRDMGIW